MIELILFNFFIVLPFLLFVWFVGLSVCRFVGLPLLIIGWQRVRLYTLPTINTPFLPKAGVSFFFDKKDNGDKSTPCFFCRLMYYFYFPVGTFLSPYIFNLSKFLRKVNNFFKKVWEFFKIPWRLPYPLILKNIRDLFHKVNIFFQHFI